MLIAETEIATLVMGINSSTMEVAATKMETVISATIADFLKFY